MGVSSAGYLGGKLARKPGPVIDCITVAHVQKDTSGAVNKLTLKIKGAVLSRDASFKIDDQEVKLDPALGGDPRPEPIVKQDDYSTTSFAKVLQLVVDNPPNDWLPATLKDAVDKKRDLNLTIINPDGKLATWPFHYDPTDPTIIKAEASSAQSP
jgi:hypothetical protein